MDRRAARRSSVTAMRRLCSVALADGVREAGQVLTAVFRVAQ